VVTNVAPYIVTRSNLNMGGGFKQLSGQLNITLIYRSLYNLANSGALRLDSCVKSPMSPTINK
jgi:hypothetical protein